MPAWLQIFLGVLMVVGLIPLVILSLVFITIGAIVGLVAGVLVGPWILLYHTEYWMSRWCLCVVPLCYIVAPLLGKYIGANWCF